jgi:hypothetical protein
VEAGGEGLVKGLVWVGRMGVNSKKPPHLWGKFEKPPQFGQIAKIHQFRGDSMQCALIAQFLQANTISARYGPLSGADVAK